MFFQKIIFSITYSSQITLHNQVFCFVLRKRSRVHSSLQLGLIIFQHLPKKFAEEAQHIYVSQEANYMYVAQGYE